jgi:membrane protein
MIRPGRDLSWKQFFKRLAEESMHDAIDDSGAALTFYGILALFPFLIFLVALASYFLTPANMNALLDQLRPVAPGHVVQLVADQLTSLQRTRRGGLLSFGAVVALWSASSGVTALMTALNRAYDVKETRPFWKTRLIGLAATFIAGGMTLVATLAAVVVPIIANAIGGPIGTAIDWLRLPIAGSFMMLTWALIYRFVPNIKLPFKILTPGSIVGVVVWGIASWGFSMYVRHFGSYDKTYGAMGGVIVLLTWMWVSAQVLLVGAEINKILAPAEKREAAAEVQARPKSPVRPLTPRPGKRSRAVAGVAAAAAALLVWRRVRA